MLPVIYSMSVSLDGFIAGLDGDIGLTAPDAERMRFHIEQTRQIAAHLCGRGGKSPLKTYWAQGGARGSIGRLRGGCDGEEPPAAAITVALANSWDLCEMVVCDIRKCFLSQVSPPVIRSSTHNRSSAR